MKNNKSIQRFTDKKRNKNTKICRNRMLISKNVSMNCKIKSGSNNCSLTDLNFLHLKNSLQLMNLVNNT